MSPAMLRIALFVGYLSLSFARTTWKDLENYSFEKYCAEFDLRYEESEYRFRKELFAKELTRIRTHNQLNLSWKEGVNIFTAMSSSELEAYHGHSKSVAQNHKPAHKESFPQFSTKVAALPSRIDWRESGVVTPVKDQGKCGSCWAFASTATIESHVAKATGRLYELSVQQTAFCTPNPLSCGGTGGCHGATAQLAFDYLSGLKSSGVFQEYSLGYAAYGGIQGTCGSPAPAGSPAARISGFTSLPQNNYTALMNAVATLGPISVSVAATPWHAYEEGVFAEPVADNNDVNHAVVLVGYGEDAALGKKYWLVRNSWAPSYGEGGYIRLLRSDDDESNCAMDATPTHGSACAGDTTPVKVCGTSGLISDSSYPLGASAL